MAFISRIPPLFWVCAIIVNINVVLVESQAGISSSFASTSTSSIETESASYLLVKNIRFEFDNGFYKNDSCEFIGTWNTESSASNDACLNLCRNIPGCQTYKWHPKNSGFCLYTERKYGLEDALAAESWTCGIRKERVVSSPSQLAPTAIPIPLNDVEIAIAPTAVPIPVNEIAPTAIPIPPNVVAPPALPITVNEKPAQESPKTFSVSEYGITPPASSTTPSQTPIESESPSASVVVTDSASVTPPSSASAEPSITTTPSPSTSATPSSSELAEPSITTTPSQSLLESESPYVSMTAATVSVLTSPSPSTSSNVDKFTHTNCYFPNFDYWKTTWGNSFAICVSACKETPGCQSFVYRIEWKICTLGRDKYKLTNAISNTNYNCGILGSSDDLPTPTEAISSPSSSVSASPSSSMSAETSASRTASASMPASISPTSSSSSTPSETPSTSMAATVSISPSPSSTPTISLSNSPSSSPSSSASSTPSASISVTASISMAIVTPSTNVKFELFNGVYRANNCFFPGFTFWKTIWGAEWDSCGESCKATPGCNTFVYLVQWQICSMSKLKFKLTDAISNEEYNCGATESSQQ